MRSLLEKSLYWFTLSVIAALASCGGGHTGSGSSQTNPIASTTQTISASQGGTISLPDGSSATIPAGLLATDQAVTLSEYSKPLAQANPIFSSIGPALYITFSNPVQLQASSLQTAKHATPQITSSTSSTNGIQFTLPIASSEAASLNGSMAFASLSNNSGSTVNLALSSPTVIDNSVQMLVQSACLVAFNTVASNSNLVAIGFFIFKSDFPPPNSPQPGILRWHSTAKAFGPAISSASSFQCTQSQRTLIVVHGMASSAEGAYTAMLSNENVASLSAVEPLYDAVFGFDYDWWNGIDQNGQVLAAFLDKLAGCTAGQLDIIAHSEGVPVSMSAMTHAQPSTKAKIGHFVALGGPIFGTPAANLIGTERSALATILASLPGSNPVYPPPSLGGIVGLINSQFALDLETDGQGNSQVLPTIRTNFSDGSLSNVQSIAIAGTDPSFLAFLPGCCGIFQNVPFDGVIGEDSALGTGLNFSYRNSFFVFHTDLVNNQEVLNAVVAQLTSSSQSQNPAPSISSLTPSSLAAGSAAQILTINGSGFLASSTVTFNGTAHDAIFVSANQLTISLSASDLATAGTFSVVVTNPAPGGGTATSDFTVAANNPTPSVSNLSPSSLMAGSAAQSITINGTGFVSASSVTFNGVAHSATYVSANQLTILLTSADLATPGTYPIIVTNPTPGGGASSPANFIVSSVSTGSGEWTWMSGSSALGSNLLGVPGVYGTLGTPAAGNVPGSRYSANSWTDQSGNFWLFGGLGMDSTGTQGDLNDFWMFNPSSKEWTWMGGSSTVGSFQPGVYGTLGVFSPTNIPAGRYTATNWTDSNGNFWLFGGYGWDSAGNDGSFNDLWEFNPATKQWAWMGGSNVFPCASQCGQAGVYGTLGTPAAGNFPGGRASATSWTDQSGNLWLFGGEGIDSTSTFGFLNDLWEFNPSSKQWTWMSGSSTVGSAAQNGSPGQPGIYGTLGIPDPANVPGGRTSASSWIDQSGNLWLYGGEGYDSTGAAGLLNDLWMFNPSSKQWTWIGGSNTKADFQPGVYGTLGTPAVGNFPGTRLCPTTWTDSTGNFWLFGGQGNDSTTTNEGVELNDLWKFNPSTKEWAWISGSSVAGTQGQPGVYGTLGTPDVINVPGGRDCSSGSIDQSGNLWLFGGEGIDSTGTFGNLNDLWEYQPVAPPACIDSSCEASCSTPLTATPSSIVVPETSNLSYSCTNVTQCQVVQQGGPTLSTLYGGTSETVSTTIPVSPSATTVYQLNCVNSQYSGDAATSSAQVTVGGSGICETNPNGVGCEGQ